MEEINIVLTGSPHGGSQAFPKGEKAIATFGDRPATQEGLLYECSEIPAFGNSNEYAYFFKVFGLHSTKGGRGNCKIGIYLNKKGSKVPKSQYDSLQKFFETFFFKGMIESAEIISYDESTKEYYFRIKNFEDVKKKLDEIIILSKGLLHKQVKFEPSEYNVSISEKVIFSKEIPDLTPSSQESPNTSSEQNQVIDDNDESKLKKVLEEINAYNENLNTTNAAVKSLSEKTSKASLLSVVSLIVSLITLLMLIVTTLNKDTIPTGVIENSPSQSTPNPNNIYDENSTSKHVGTNEPRSPRNKEINLKECCLQQKGNTFKLTGNPFQNGYTKLDEKVANLDDFISFLANELEEYGIQTIVGAPNQASLISSIKNNNPNDLDSIKDLLSEEENVTYKRLLERVLEGKDFIVYIK